ncbi:hypothetical protein OS493_007864 [Desmophyllum pertusum]|uniref:Uncharacterized protein n=1 Tax=Desmophyllum pertusum TaxID=174260 RepID=A0A9W9YRY8_9CNID|nr:hypothetical protein OS493_007864 [Desmophyllum pertusum]
MAAVSDGNGKSLEDVDYDLQRNLKGVNTRTPDLSTLAQKGDEKLVEQFMTEDVQISGGADEKLQSQLYIACFWGFHDVVKTLLDKGADVNAQNKGTLWTPLHAATFQEHGKIVMLLLGRNAQPELLDSEGRSAKDFASASDKVWPHFAALNCPRTSKQELIEKGIIKKLEDPSRVGSAGRPGSGPKARMAAFSRPGSAYVLQSDPFSKRHTNQESSDFPLGAPVGGDILAGSNTRERGDKFWNVSEVEMKFSVERQWIKAVRKAKRKPNYGMLNMDAQLEEVVGNKLELVGPIIDSYLHEIGKSMKSKLSRSKATGIVNLVSLFVPWTVFPTHTDSGSGIRGYSGDVHIQGNGSKHVLILTKMDSVRKLFSPSRFSGETLFAQRHFKRVPSKAGGKTESVYNGRSAIVVTESTPFCMNYAMKKQRVTVTFYIQRYTAEHFVLDSSLQALMNG